MTVYVLPSLASLNHQLRSWLLFVVSPASARENTSDVLRLAPVIILHAAFSSSYLNPNSSYISILSCMSVFNGPSNTVTNCGMTCDKTASAGTMSLRVMGPSPDSKFPAPPLAPSPATNAILLHCLSWDRPVVDDTSLPFKNFLVSGDVNFINAPGMAYFRLLVEKFPTTKGPAPWK